MHTGITLSVALSPVHFVPTISLDRTLCKLVCLYMTTRTVTVLSMLSINYVNCVCSTPPFRSLTSRSR